MTARLNYIQAAPEAFKAVRALETYVSETSGIAPRLLHLLKLRASQLNGCAYCVDMHTKHARKDGMGEQWLSLISVWRETAVFDAKERALLAWVDAVTELSRDGVSDPVFNELPAHFTDEEMTKLTVAIGTINVWNRLAVAFRSQHPIDE